MKNFTKLLKKLFKSKSVLFLLTIFLVIILSFCASRKEGMSDGSNPFANSNVPSSTPVTFSQDISGGPKLVWFYAEWCGHCKTMLSDWDTLAQAEGKDKMIKINVGEQSNSQQENIAKEYGVSSYPTIMTIDGATKNEYTGDRSISGLKTAIP